MEIYIHANKVHYKFIKIFLLTILPFAAFSQANDHLIINSRLEGRVLDSATKQGVAGATLRIKGITHEVLSGENGKFEFITGQKFPYTLIVSYVGYKTKEVVADGSPITIQISENLTQLNDVVIVGYGSQKKTDVTGSLSSISRQNLNQASSSVDNLLSGAAPGIQVTQSSGQPGASASVRIRGGNSIYGGNEPLYVVDGYPVYNDNSKLSSFSGTGTNPTSAGVNALSTINPADIESVEILKDASATSIYGSRGANGVVLITTKKGKRGSNNVSYQVYAGSQKISHTIPLLDGSQWASLRNDILASQNLAPAFTDAQVAAFGKGTDWQKEGFRTAPIQNHEIVFSGGDEKSRYYIGGNYFDQDGILRNTGFKRYSLRINYDRDISSKFKIGINATTTYSASHGAAANIASTALNSPNVIVGLIATSPVLPVKDQNGNYVLNTYSTIPTNPIQDINSIINQTNVNRSLGNFYGEYKLVPWLTAKVTFGADLASTKQNFYAPSYTTDSYGSFGYASIGTAVSSSWVNENTLTYDKTINNDHYLNILAGYTTQYFVTETATAGAKNFVTDLTTFNNLYSGSQVLSPTSSSATSVLNSYLARVNYSYQHKYNLTVSARADGSSSFGSAKHWGYFPSAGLSWNATEESFIKNVSAISNLKLRVSAGLTGNQQIPPYLYLSLLGAYPYTFNNSQSFGLAPSQLENDNLHWEQTSQYDGGLDLGLFDSRVNLVFDAYYKKTTNVLLSVPIPLSTGQSISTQNLGSVENKGIELGINTDNIKGGDFSWKTSVVFSLNRNKVLSLAPGQVSFFPAIPNGVLGLLQPEIIKVGLPLGTFWGYRTAGIFQSTAEINQYPTLNTKANTKPGDQRYMDVNHDGLITPADKVNLGSAPPKFNGSFGNTFTYKGFDLVVFFQGSYGGKIYDALHQQLNITNLTQNSWADETDRWTPTNPSNVIPRATNGPVAQMIDRYVENSSYLRLKNLVFGYTFNGGILSKIHAKQLRLYASAQNLVTWTKYKGFDPEVNSFEQSNIAPGIDYGAYPNYKTYLLGLNVTF